jgi:enamine deaminase RidA (YjgF/YER057c/UK114 family)
MVMAQAITRLNPPTLPDAGNMGYSQISIVEPGRMAYISGQVAWRPDGQPPPTDLVEQLKIVATNAKAALDALGATPHDIVIARCFMVDLSPETLALVFPPLLELFDGAKPCITGVGVASLAAPELKVELELTVRLPD